MKGLPLARPQGNGLAVSGTEELEVGALYRAHAQRVAAWASRLAGPSHDVEDMVQEVFLTVQRLLPGFRREAQVTTWLFRITFNVVRHRRRKERWRRWFGSVEEAGALACGRPGPSEELERREAAALVYRALDRLSERYRTVIILFEIEGLPGEKVAELMGAKLATVWVWLHRGRAAFAEAVERVERERRERLVAGGAA